MTTAALQQNPEFRIVERDLDGLSSPTDGQPTQSWTAIAAPDDWDVYSSTLRKDLNWSATGDPIPVDGPAVPASYPCMVRTVVQTVNDRPVRLRFVFLYLDCVQHFVSWLRGRVTGRPTGAVAEAAMVGGDSEPQVAFNRYVAAHLATLVQCAVNNGHIRDVATYHRRLQTELARLARREAGTATPEDVTTANQFAPGLQPPVTTATVATEEASG